MNFTDFFAKWGTDGTAASLNERQGAQPHFMDLCALLGVPTPGSSAGDEDNYLFEQSTLLLGQARGYADVFKRGCFAWENKKPGRNLDDALKQLRNYAAALDNPPLLVVSDRAIIRVHTQFTGHPSTTHEIKLADLEHPEKRALLKNAWLNPEWFRPKETTLDITLAAANSFATLAARLRNRGLILDKKGDKVSGVAVNEPQAVAHFLTQCLFCFFAEDVGLLPDRLFQKMIDAKLDSNFIGDILPSEKLSRGLSTLFNAMRTGDLFGIYDIDRFNGGLFQTIAVPKLDILDVTELRNAARLNWSAIDVSIFGTLFERGLDPKKRSQLGAHYTDPATILRIIEPVIRRPLLAIWEQTSTELEKIMLKSVRKGDASHKAAQTVFVHWLEQLKAYRVLDPACGSGNFLYTSLKVLKDIEHQSHLKAQSIGLDREADLVTGPHNMLGIELNEYAAELARLSVWIGELQWRMDKGYSFRRNPVLEPLDCIECRDALITVPAESVEGSKTPSVRAEPVEADWPKASVVVGNPPFLGDRKMIRELGEDYTFKLRKVYEGRVPGGADLVCYWFEKARTALEKHGLGAAGLVATNSLRGGANRKVLDAIVQTSRLYEAWSDEYWVNDGAAVRVSLVCFGHADQTPRLNNVDVEAISSDLSAAQSISSVKKLKTNVDASYIGTQKNGPFDISHELASQWLRLPNPNGKSNAQVVRPWANGLDVTRRPQNRWVVDFGCDMSIDEASLFEAPFAYIEQAVKPTRSAVRRDFHRNNWWLYGDARPGLRQKLTQIQRFIVTSMVAKHRVFAWMPAIQIPENLCVVVTRTDDTTFGILHSRFHELWSLRMGTSLEDRPRYTPTTCFETFPFPAGLTPHDTASQQTRRLASGAVVPDVPSKAAEAIAEAAYKLTTLRDNWLNPPDWTQRLPEVVPLGMDVSPYPDRIVPKNGYEQSLSERTLTKLYNARPAWLATAHAALDAAVAAAYGWTDYTPDMPDETILQRLLALNVERSQSNAKV
jgi:hypothetical protein